MSGCSDRLLRSFRLARRAFGYRFPEVLMRQTFTASNAFPRLGEQALKAWRPGQQQPFQVVIVHRREQHSDCLAVTRDHNRSLRFALFNIGAELRFDFCQRGNSHGLNSSLPINNRSRVTPAPPPCHTARSASAPGGCRCRCSAARRLRSAGRRRRPGSSARC